MENFGYIEIITNFVIVTRLLNMQTTESLNQTELIRMMHERGLRPSAQRLSVLSHVANTRKHPTADEIFNDISPLYPSLSRTTIYNSLHALVECGLLRTLEIESGNQRYDLAPQPPHGHFACRCCGKIYDAPLPPGIDSFENPDFSVEYIDVVYRGICPDCKKK